MAKDKGGTTVTLTGKDPGGKLDKILGKPGTANK